MSPQHPHSLVTAIGNLWPTYFTCTPTPTVLDYFKANSRDHIVLPTNSLEDKDSGFFSNKIVK